MAFEQLQDVYTKNDNVLVVLEPKSGDVFTNETLSAVEILTDRAWQVPFAIRVDGLTNFQYTRAEDDDLIVEDLVTGAAFMTTSELEHSRKIALSESRLVDVLIPPNSKVVGVNITVQLPGEDIMETAKVAESVRAIAREIEELYPDIKTHLTGMVMINTAFGEASQNDMGTLVPLMFLGIVIVIAILAWNYLPVSTHSDSIEVEKSIAVLPFKSLSEDPEKQYLADGMMDAIVLHLSKIEDLRVITRTSVEKYRNPTQTIPEIAGELQVNHILEGSFQKYGNQARLIVHLSNAEEKEDAADFLWQ